MAKTHCGVTLAYSTDGTSYTDFAGVTSMTPPEATIKDVDATALDTANCRETFLPGFLNGGQFDAEINYLYTLVNTIDDFFTGRTSLYLKITFPDDNASNDSTFVMTGYINKWRVADQMTPGKTTSLRAMFGFKVNSVGTYTPAV